MSSDSIDQVFERAISTIHTLSSLRGFNSLPRPPAQIRIELYALYKQSTEGDVELVLAQPTGNPLSPEFNVALRKWDAWKTKEGLSKTDAKKEYIQLLISTMKSYAMGTIAARELLADLEFLWWQVTNETGEIVDDNSSMMMAIQDELQDAKSLRLRKEIYETLSSLNENKPRDSPNGLSENRNLGKGGNSRFTRLKKLLFWFIAFILRHVLAFIKKVVIGGILTLGILATMKCYGQLSPLIIDFNTSPAQRCTSRGFDNGIFSKLSNSFWFALRIVNNYCNLKINRITLNIE